MRKNYPTEEFLKDFIEAHNIKFTKEGTFLGNDTCLVSLGNEYCNNSNFHVDDPKRKVVGDFCYWLERFFKVCDGVDEKAVN